MRDTDYKLISRMDNRMGVQLSHTCFPPLFNHRQTIHTHILKGQIFPQTQPNLVIFELCDVIQRVQSIRHPLYIKNNPGESPFVACIQKMFCTEYHAQYIENLIQCLLVCLVGAL